MPKLKTNRAAAKRFRKTAKGFKRYASHRRHNLGHKDRKVLADIAVHDNAAFGAIAQQAKTALGIS